MTKEDKDRFFHHNLSFISVSSRNHILAQSVQKEKLDFDKGSDELILFTSRRGGVSLKWREKNLHSSVNPLQEAHRRMEGVSPDKYITWVYLGADLLYSLDILNGLPPQSKLLLIFLNWEFLFTVLKARPLPLKKFSHVEVVCLEEGERIHQMLEVLLSPSTKILVNDVLYQEADDFKRLYGIIEEHSQLLMSSFLTRYYFDKRWMKNVIQNWRMSIHAYSLSSLEGEFEGEGAVLIGSGVSLSEHIPHLKKLQSDGYCLVAVDTSLPTLLGNGLSPEIVVALDGGYQNAGDFSQMPSSDTILITYPHLYPSVIRDFPGKVVFFFFEPDRDQGISDILLSVWEKRCGESVGIMRSSNVSVAAAQILTVLGFKEVILSGIDFGFPFFQSHSPGGAHHNHYLKHQSRFRNLETAEFEEIYQRMTEKDKSRFQLGLQLKPLETNQKGEQSREGDTMVTTLLMDHSMKEFRKQLRRMREINWSCLPSVFSRLNGEVPVALTKSTVQSSNPFQKLTDSMPMLSMEELDFFLKEAEKAILLAESYLGYCNPSVKDCENLQSQLKSLGWNFSAIYYHVSIIYSRAENHHEKILREVGNTLAMMKSGITNLLRNTKTI